MMVVILKRTEMRQMFNIAGSTRKDAITGYCCTCCATIQQFNEAERRLGPGVTGSALGYQLNEDMVVLPATEQAPAVERNPASKETNSTPSAPA